MSSVAGLRFVSSEELRAAGLMARCISALEHRLAIGWDLTEPARSITQVGEGQLFLMPGWDAANVAVKVNTILPGGDKSGMPRVQGVYVVFELPRMSPVMVVDAAGLTALRTPAMSAVATKYLACPDASRLVVFGTGPQAVGHVEAMRVVRNVTSVGIVSRTPEPGERLAAELRHSGLDAARTSPTAVADADIVCTCTTSRVPVFDGSMLRAGAHVNAVGSHEPSARELDDATLSGVAVVVDSLDMALREAGDIVMALASGALPDAESLLSLQSIVRSEVSTEGAARTVFKSVGTAGQDLVAGQLLLEIFADQ